MSEGIPAALAVETIWSVENTVDGIKGTYIVVIVLLSILLVGLIVVAVVLAVSNSRVYAKRELEAAARLQGGAPLSNQNEEAEGKGGDGKPKEGGSHDEEEEDEEYDEEEEEGDVEHNWGAHNGNDQEMERR